MNDKKAVIEIQFNWIFILVAGGLILFFFLTLSLRQKEVSTRKLSTDLLQDMELIISGQSVSVGRSNLLEIPPMEIFFTCNDYTILDNSKPLQGNIVFSSPTIIGPNMLTWTKDWGAPFRITNFVYLTSSAVKYYLINDPANPMVNEFVTQLSHDLPPELNLNVKENEQDALPENNPQARFIFISTGEREVNIPSKFRNTETELSALQIIITEQGALGLHASELIFYTTNKERIQFIESGRISSLGRAAMYGAIYTADFEHYACTMDKALKRMNLMGNIYEKRTQKLHDAVREDCQPFFAGIDFSLLINADSSNIPQLAEELEQFIDDLHRRNEAAIIRSCPTVY